MRLIRISLAAKYRLLFGVAVLLIIGAALTLPWHRLERLALEKPFREAQRVADDYFRLVLSEPISTRGGVGSHSSESSPIAEVGGVTTTFISMTDHDRSPATAGDRREDTPFVERALDGLSADPTRKFLWETDPERSAFNYAHAVRITQSCLECHGEGKTAARYAENELAGLIVVSLPIEDVGRDIAVNRIVFIAAGLLAGVLAILLFYVITRKFILGPINELRDVAQRVTEGDTDVRSNLRTGDEFEQLADSLNIMLTRLHNTQDELKTANRSLDLKLGEMAETNVNLFESNRLKSEFLANVSHELRTPLTSIIGFAELLRESPETDADSKTARYTENILISGRILLEIINDLLDLAKIEAGKIELRIQDVDVAEVCHALAGFVRPLTQKKAITVSVDAAENLPVLRSDRGRIRQILFNLLSNAIKFTPHGGRVAIALQRADQAGIRVSVSDTGPGIDPEHQKLIFEKFRQIDASATREHHGTGLGLAIAKELASLLGGTIGLQSRPGAGATFWVQFPAEAPDTSDRPLVSLT